MPAGAAIERILTNVDTRKVTGLPDPRAHRAAAALIAIRRCSAAAHAARATIVRIGRQRSTNAIAQTGAIRASAGTGGTRLAECALDAASATVARIVRDERALAVAEPLAGVGAAAVPARANLAEIAGMPALTAVGPIRRKITTRIPTSSVVLRARNGARVGDPCLHTRNLIAS